MKIRCCCCVSVLVVDDAHDIAGTRYAHEQVIAATGGLDQITLTNILHVPDPVATILEQGDDVVRSKTCPLPGPTALGVVMAVPRMEKAGFRAAIDRVRI